MVPAVLGATGNEPLGRQREELIERHAAYATAMARELSEMGIPERPEVGTGDDALEIIRAMTERQADPVPFVLRQRRAKGRPARRRLGRDRPPRGNARRIDRRRLPVSLTDLAPKERPPARGGRFAPAVTVAGGRRWATAGGTPAIGSISFAPPPAQCRLAPFGALRSGHTAVVEASVAGPAMLQSSAVSWACRPFVGSQESTSVMRSGGYVLTELLRCARGPDGRHEFPRTTALPLPRSW